jgi:Flp pilus assembly protein CpaB
VTDEELDERLRAAFAAARLPDDKLAGLVAQAEPLTRRRGWDRWLVGLAVAAALGLAVWPAVSDQVTGAGSLAPSTEEQEGSVDAEPAPVAAPVAPTLQVPSGSRAIQVPVPVRLDTQLFVPGARVDVLATLDGDRGAETVTVLDAVLLAVDDGTTARLAVTPAEAEKVAHAVNVGVVQLAGHLDAASKPTDAQAPWRAVVVPAPLDELGSGFLGPGARVDVLVTLTPEEGSATTRTLLHDVRVAGSLVHRDHPDDPYSAFVTLVVSPEDAEVLVLGNHLGVLTFTRR